MIPPSFQPNQDLAGILFPASAIRKPGSNAI
jgi:hypothetical protein